MPQLGEPFPGETLDVGVRSLLRRCVGILVEAEIGLSIPGLGVLFGPAADLSGVDQDLAIVSLKLGP